MATYKGLDVINAIFNKSTVTLSNAVKNAYAAKVQAVIDASTNSATLDASVVSKLLKLSLVRNEMVKSFDSNVTNKLDTVTELNSAKGALGQTLTDLKNAVNDNDTTNAITVVGVSTTTLTSAADTINFTAGTYTATLVNFAAGDKLNLPDTFLSTVTLTNTSGSDGQITLQADDGTANVIDIILTGIPAATDATIYNMTTFYTAFGSGSII